MPQNAPIPLRLAAPDVYWRHAWDVAGQRYSRPDASASSGREAVVRRELLFCVLGGHGVSYELNRSAAELLWRKGLFRHWRPRAASLETELARSQFAPPRRDGGPRRYRFPARKARLLVEAASWLGRVGMLSDALAAICTERERRALLCGCPGVGPKSASWLLRNCGLAERLAILDVHVLRVLRESGRVTEAMLPRDYEHVEETFLSWCDELGADPAGFDLLLWEWSRMAEP
jgi:N-glycosylase/DNA lyase